jgi:hypothetical protein
MKKLLILAIFFTGLLTGCGGGDDEEPVVQTLSATTFDAGRVGADGREVAAFLATAGGDSRLTSGQVTFSTTSNVGSCSLTQDGNGGYTLKITMLNPQTPKEQADSCTVHATGEGVEQDIVVTSFLDNIAPEFAGNDQIPLFAGLPAEQGIRRFVQIEGGYLIWENNDWQGIGGTGNFGDFPGAAGKISISSVFPMKNGEMVTYAIFDVSGGIPSLDLSSGFSYDASTDFFSWNGDQQVGGYFFRVRASDEAGNFVEKNLNVYMCPIGTNVGPDGFCS